MNYVRYVLMIIAVLLMLVCTITANVFAFSDVSSSSIYSAALDRVSSLNIINGDETGLFRPNSFVSREQFAKIIVKAVGLENSAALANGTTKFTDVGGDRWSSGYINVASQKGYINGVIGGAFDPESDVTLGQACTILVKALNYNKDVDSAGKWPQNYIDKARNLGLIDDIKLGNNDSLPRWAAVSMIDKFLACAVRQNILSVLSTDIANLCTDCIILGDSTTVVGIAQDQILTDKGIFHIYNKDLKLELGKKYKVAIYNDSIIKSYGSVATTSILNVGSISGSKVQYNEGDIIKSFNLPQKTVYYYGGQKEPYTDLPNVIYKNTKIIFGNNFENTGYEYGLILDPILHSSGKYVEAAILGDSGTLDKLTDKQVLTDKGIYYLNDNVSKLEIGNKYGFVVENDTITQLGKSLKTMSNISVENMLDTKVVYQSGGTEQSMFLPDKTSYYYNGEKVTLDSLKNVIQRNTLIAFANNDNGLGYDYAVVVDPKFSKPEVVSGDVGISKKIGDIKLSDGLSIVRDGKLVKSSDIEDKDVVYSVKDFLGNNEYILAINNKIGGEISDISPNKAAPKSIKIGTTSYDLDKDVNVSKINNTAGAFNVDDKVTVVLGRTGKIIDVFKYDAKCNPYAEYIILGDSDTLSTIGVNQVLTDKGTFYLGDKSMNLEVGNKYKLVVSDDTIVKVGDSLKTISGITVDSILQDTVTYRAKGSDNIYSMILSPDTVYYYSGTEQTYANIKSILTTNTSVIFANYDNGSGYEYAIVVAPKYGKPEVVPDGFNSNVSSNVGAIDLNNSGVIVKNGGYINTDGDKVNRSGDYIKASDLQRNDVLYKVTDLWGGNPYILVVDKKVLGTIKDIYPNKLSPQKINVNGTQYEFSKDMDMDVLKDRMSIFTVDSNAILLLGYDGKIVDIKWTW